MLTSISRRLRQTLLTASLGACAIGASLVAAPSAHALSPYLEIPDEAEAMKSPAYQYANMTDEEAFAELDRRGILYSKEKSVPGVRAPIRLTGRLHGVLIRSVLPPEERATSMFEILDARLALSLDDFAAILSAHDVDEVVHYTMYRPNMPKPEEEDGAGETDKNEKPHAPKDGEHVGHPSKKKPGTIDTKPSKTKPVKPSKAHQKQAYAAPTDDRDADDAEEGHDVPVASFDLTGATNNGDFGGENAKAPGPKKRASATHPVARAKKATAAKSGRIVTAQKDDSDGDKDKDKDAKPRGKWAPPGTRHPAGLAIDVGVLKKKDGTELSVAAQFDGKIGEQTCGKGAPEPSRADARELRAIVCEAHDKGIFTYTLTPNFDRAHRDHFHMEIKPGVKWFLYN